MDSATKSRLEQRIRTDAPGAMAELVSMSKTLPSDPEVLFLLGLANFRLGRFADAEQEFRRSSALDHGNATTVFYVGLCAERLSRQDDALKSYRAAYALNPGMREAREKLEQFGETVQGTGAPGRERTGAKSDSQLWLPEGDEEFEEYERRRKQMIDLELRLWPRSIPKWMWAIVAVIATAIVATIIIWAVRYVTSLREQDESVRYSCEQLSKSFEPEDMPSWCVEYMEENEAPQE